MPSVSKIQKEIKTKRKLNMGRSLLCENCDGLGSRFGGLCEACHEAKSLAGWWRKPGSDKACAKCHISSKASEHIVFGDVVFCCWCFRNENDNEKCKICLYPNQEHFDKCRHCKRPSTLAAMEKNVLPPTKKQKKK